MKVKQRPPPSTTNSHSSDRAALLSGTVYGNTHSPTMKNDDLAAKKTNTSKMLEKSKESARHQQEKLSQVFPTKKKAGQPVCRKADPRQRSFTCLEAHYPRMAIKPKWLWKLPQWRRFTRALKVPCPRPPRPRPQATTAQLKIQTQSQGKDRVNKCSLARSVRSLQLCTSSSESSPSPPVTPGRTRQVHHSYRTRRYLKQLMWYQALRNERKKAQKTAQSSVDSSAVKGTSECLDNLALSYQREKRKRSLPSAQNLPATKKALGKTSRKLWTRRLDSSSSTDSPVSEGSANVTPVCAHRISSSSSSTLNLPDAFTSPQAAFSTQMKSAKANISAVSHQSSTPIPKQLNRKRVTFAEQEKSKSADYAVADLRIFDISTKLDKFAPTQKTAKCPGTVKMVKFKDSPKPGNLPPASATQISHETGRSESTVSPASRLRLPSTPHVCKSKKSKRHCKGSALTKHQVKTTTCNGLKVNGRRQSDKSNLNSTAYLHSAIEMVPSLQPVMRDPCQSKNGISHVCQTTSNTPSQVETRLQDHPQTHFKTASAKRSDKHPTSKASLSTYKHPAFASQVNLKTANLTPGHNNNRRTLTPTPFRRPDTPRPKSCPEFLERRSETTRQVALRISYCQGQLSPKNAELPPPVIGNEAEHSSERSFKLSSCLTPIRKLMQTHTNRPATGFENSYHMKRIRDGRGEITKRQDSAKVSVNPSLARTNSIQAAIDARIGECQYHVLKLEPTLFVQSSPLRLAQGGNHTWPLCERENRGQAAQSHSTEASEPDRADSSTP